MHRDAIIAVIRSEETALKQAGVKSLAFVGSSARDDRSEASDVDALIDGTCLAAPSVCQSMSAGGDALNPLVRERMVKDAIKIF